VKIVYTKHALEKFAHPDIKKFNLREKDIERAFENPDYHGIDPLRKVEFILKKIDSEHILRVIYKVQSSIITIITFYPSAEGRYEK